MSQISQMTSRLFLALFVLAIGAAAQEPAVIPKPVAMELTGGSFALGPDLAIVAPGDLTAEGEFLKTRLNDGGITRSEVRSSAVTKRSIMLSLDGSDLPPEGYRLEVLPDRVDLRGADAAGVFHGIQTLMHLLPAAGTQDPTLPCLRITDHPRFAWRGMHLDVCRHFFPVEFVKTYIDLLARYKMNRFHWHLTDDQGWRIEIKRYPRLTEVGAWRDGSMVGPYSDQRFDNERYGGFYTQEQIREVVAYAAERHITIVPEIEMPGHAMAALASYPELGCTGGPYEVQRGWGVFEDVFCTREETFTFLENVLAEVIELFPGEYIHIGGDECPKTRWKECVRCQSLMRREGLKDEHELQSYFIRRIEKFVNGKGRKIIGWDEILEGGLAPNAAVMSWRGTAGGTAAAEQRHPVVMSPGTPCYFDHYQGDPSQEPLAFGGYNTVQNVLGFEPIPAELPDSLHRYILGAQGNLWTEYITTREQVEYMALPRMCALSEVVWNPKGPRNEADFIRRLETEFERLDGMGVNYSRSLYNVGFHLSLGREPGTVRVAMSCAAPEGSIHYTLDGRVLDARSPVFSDTIMVQEDAEVQAAFFRGGEAAGRITERVIRFNLATARPITCVPPPNERYALGGPFTLVDGVSAGPRRVNTEWLGWVAAKDPVTITVDLGSEMEISHIGIGALEERVAWIHPPEVVNFSTSTDGVVFTDLGRGVPDPGATGRMDLEVDGSVKARSVRFEVRGVAKIPDGMAGAGQPAWIFLDEVVVR